MTEGDVYQGEEEEGRRGLFQQSVKGKDAELLKTQILSKSYFHGVIRELGQILISLLIFPNVNISALSPGYHAVCSEHV